MGLRTQFGTDKDLETKTGVVLQYDGFRLRILRANASNKRYTKALNALTQPVQRSIETKTITAETSQKIMLRAYARGVIIEWETEQQDGSWKKGIEGPDGKLLPFNEDNVVATLEEFPDLFRDIQNMADNIALFREEVLEDEAKN